MRSTDLTISTERVEDYSAGLLLNDFTKQWYHDPFDEFNQATTGLPESVVKHRRSARANTFALSMEEVTSSLEVDDYLRLFSLNFLHASREYLFRFRKAVSRLKNLQGVDILISTPLPPEWDLTQPAREAATAVSDKAVREQAERVLAELQDQLNRVQSIENLPPVRAIESEDGSLLVEWIFSHFRIGFNLESQREESGWYLVSDATAGGIQASGFLAQANLARLIAWLLGYVVANAG